jgi:hypothetical protein
MASAANQASAMRGPRVPVSTLEYCPVTYDLAMRLAEEVIAIGEDLIDRTGLFGDPWIGCDPGDSAQDERGDTDCACPATVRFGHGLQIACCRSP